MLGGGVIADRLGRRPVMLGADAARCAAQVALAAVVLAGRPALWVFIAAAVARGTGDAVFTPALSGLTAELTPQDDLVNANALLAAARSAATVAGPGLAGVLVALAGPGTVIAVDAASYAVSVLALASLRLPAARPGAPRLGAASSGAAPSYLSDLRDGWAEFRGRPWLVITTVQFTLFNLLTWGPYLLLGPVLCRDYLGGAGAWGAVMACYGGGSVLGALLALGRGRPAPSSRPPGHVRLRGALRAAGAARAAGRHRRRGAGGRGRLRPGRRLRRRGRTAAASPGRAGAGERAADGDRLRVRAAGFRGRRPGRRRSRGPGRARVRGGLVRGEQRGRPRSARRCGRSGRRRPALRPAVRPRPGGPGRPPPSPGSGRPWSRTGGCRCARCPRRPGRSAAPCTSRSGRAGHCPAPRPGR